MPLEGGDDWGKVEREDSGRKAQVITTALTSFPNRPLYSLSILLH